MADLTRRQIAMMADEFGIADYPAAVRLVRRAFEVSRSARAALAEPGPEDDVALLREALLATAAQRRAEDDARIALAADGPAVPEGRETASVVGESIDVEQVAQQVFEAMRFSGATSPAPPEWVPGGNSLMQDHARDVARAILTRWGPQPAPPAEGEVGELVAWLRAWALGTMEEGQPATSRSLTRAAELLEQRHPEPVPVPKGPTRDDLWELWLRLNNELPDRPAAVAEFWEHAQIDARARAALAELEPVAWLWEYIDSDPYPHRLSPVARSLREMDPANPPFPDSWRPVAPLYALPLPQQETTND